MQGEIDRIGLAIMRPSPSATIRAVVQAEQEGITTAWSTVAGTAPDNVTILAIAATQTEHVTLGTSIVPAYPRHPVVLASQALVFADLAPSRLRLGVGPSHRPTIEGMLGLDMGSPLRYTKEYVTVLRDLLWEGRSDFDGEYFRVHAAIPQNTPPPRTPILLSALRPNAFHQAGQISDGAISWLCPVKYLVDTAAPALRAGADEAGRPVPPLVAHVPVALTADRGAAHEAGRAFLTRYAQLPFYVKMFRAAGFNVRGDGTVPDDLLDSLIVSGDGETVIGHLTQILGNGIDELLVTLLRVGEPDTLQTEFARALQGAAG